MSETSPQQSPLRGQWRVKLLVDDRERDVIAKLQELAPTSIAWETTRLSNGDFSIINPETNATIVMIERKTYSDFAQSIKDGRMENITRMLELARAVTPQPRVALILEGNARGNTHIDGISLKSIYSKINHLWLRDDVYWVQTINTDKTAQYLIGLTESAQTIKTHGAAPARTPAARLPVAPQTPGQIALAMFMQMPRIGRARAQKLVAANTSVAQFITNPNTTYTPSLAIDVLTTIRGMSAERARNLLAHVGGTLQQLAIAQPDALASFKFATLAQRAHEALNFCEAI